MKKIILVFVAIVYSIFSNAQTTKKILYDKNWKVTKYADSMSFYRIVKLDAQGKALDTIRDFFVSGELQAKMDGALFVDTLDDNKSKLIGNDRGYYKSGAKRWLTVRDSKGTTISSVGWYEDGKFRYNTPYVNGKREGTGKTYYESGTILYEIQYHNDKKDGKQLSYYEKGALYSEVSYENDMQNGASKGYYESGEMKSVARFVNDTVVGVDTYYYKNGKIQAEMPYNKGSLDGSCKMYFENGDPKSVYDYVNGKLNGFVTVYWPNKLLRRRDKYEAGKMVDGHCYDVDGKAVPYYEYYLDSPEDLVFTIVQKMPNFKGNLNEFLSANIKYPKYEQSKSIIGTVYINFIIEKDGTVSNVKVLKGVAKGPGLDAEAVRVISSMPAWTPGLQNGFAVRVSYNIPIRFVLN